MTANADIPVGDGERRHDPMLDVLTRYHGCRACGIVKDTGRAHSEYGKYEDQGPYYVLFSDLPALIARVREDERAAALRDAANAVINYGEERKSNLPFGTPADDITAALRVAATRIADLGDKIGVK